MINSIKPEAIPPMHFSLQFSQTWVAIGVNISEALLDNHGRLLLASIGFSGKCYFHCIIIMEIVTTKDLLQGAGATSINTSSNVISGMTVVKPLIPKVFVNNTWYKKN